MCWQRCTHLILCISSFSHPSDSHKNGVKHYHIKRIEGKYYVTERHRFDTIPELIEYHKHNAGGEDRESGRGRSAP